MKMLSKSVIHYNEAPSKTQYVTQVLATLAVSLGPFAAGLGKGYTSPAIASLQQLQVRAVFNASAATFIVTEQQASWIASLSLLGALFGGIFGGMAMRFGRKRVIIVTSLPYSVAWMLTVLASSVEMMFVSAFVAGLCCSIVSMVTQVYIIEISAPDIRGCLSALLKISGQMGMLISFSAGAYLDWRQLATIVAVAPIMLFVTTLYVPETPSYLMLAGRDEDARQALQWLRGAHCDVRSELATIRLNVLRGVTNHSFSTHILKPAFITCGLMFFQRFSGANAFNFYTVTIFRQTFNGMDPHRGAIAVAFVQLLASLLSGLLVDNIGRLPLLMASSIFMSISLASFGSFSYYEEIHKHQNIEQYDWIPLLCVLVFTVAFSLGIGPISWLLIGELFPLEHRGLGSSLAASFSYLCAFLGVKTFVDIRQWLGLHGTFWLYSSLSCGGLGFIVMCVPETKGTDLDEMDIKCA